MGLAKKEGGTIPPGWAYRDVSTAPAHGAPHIAAHRAPHIANS